MRMNLLLRKLLKRACLVLFLALPLFAFARHAFVHPGLSFTQGDLDRIKAMIDARVEPYYTGFQRFKASHYSVLSASVVDRGGVLGTESDFMNKTMSDGNRAFNLAFIYHMTGDTNYANKAVQFLNANSSITNCSSTGTQCLNAGRCKSIVEAAELLRDYPGWAAADQRKFRDMLVYPGYSDTVDYRKLYGNSTLTNNHITFYWNVYDLTVNYGNQSQFGQGMMMAMGVYLDNEKMFDRACLNLMSRPSRTDDLPSRTGPPIVSENVYSENQYVRNWDFFGRSDEVADWGYDEQLLEYIYPNGQGQEAHRDQPHNLVGHSLLDGMCDIAWNQGFDAYGLGDGRLLLGWEWNLRYNLSYVESYPDQTIPWEPTGYTLDPSLATFENGLFLQARSKIMRIQSLDISPKNRGQSMERNTGGREGSYYHYKVRAGYPESRMIWLTRFNDRSRRVYYDNTPVSNSEDYNKHVDWGLFQKRREARMAGDPGTWKDGERVSGIHRLPGTIRAADFDFYSFETSGEGFTYHNASTATNTVYRDDASVEIRADNEVGAVVTGLVAGEWMNYTLAAATGDVYTVTSTTLGSGPVTLKLEMDERSELTKTFAGETTLTVPSGAHVLRVTIVSAPADAELVSLSFARTGGVPVFYNADAALTELNAENDLEIPDGVTTNLSHLVGAGTIHVPAGSIVYFHGGTIGADVVFTGEGRLVPLEDVTFTSKLTFPDFAGTLAIPEGVTIYRNFDSNSYGFGASSTLSFEGGYLKYAKGSQNDSKLPAIAVVEGTSSLINDTTAASGNGQNIGLDKDITGSGNLILTQGARRLSFGGVNTNFTGCLTLNGYTDSSPHAIQFSHTYSAFPQGALVITRSTSVEFNVGANTTFTFGSLQILPKTVSVKMNNANQTIVLGSRSADENILDVPFTGNALTIVKVGTGPLYLGENFSAPSGTVIRVEGGTLTVAQGVDLTDITIEGEYTIETPAAELPYETFDYTNGYTCVDTSVVAYLLVTNRVTTFTAFPENLTVPSDGTLYVVRNCAVTNGCYLTGTGPLVITNATLALNYTGSSALNPFRDYAGTVTLAAGGAAKQENKYTMVSDQEPLGLFGMAKVIFAGGHLRGFKNYNNLRFPGGIEIPDGWTGAITNDLSSSQNGVNLRLYAPLTGSGDLNIHQRSRWVTFSGSNDTFSGEVRLTGGTTTSAFFDTVEAGLRYGRLIVDSPRALELKHAKNTTIRFGDLVLTNASSSVKFANGGRLELGLYNATPKGRFKPRAAGSVLDVPFTGKALELTKVGANRLTLGKNFTCLDGSTIDFRSGELNLNCETFTNMSLTVPKGAILSGSGTIGNLTLEDGAVVSNGVGEVLIATSAVSGSFTKLGEGELILPYEWREIEEPWVWDGESAFEVACDPTWALGHTQTLLDFGSDEGLTLDKIILTNVPDGATATLHLKADKVTVDLFPTETPTVDHDVISINYGVGFRRNDPYLVTTNTTPVGARLYPSIAGDLPGTAWFAATNNVGTNTSVVVYRHEEGAARPCEGLVETHLSKNLWGAGIVETCYLKTYLDDTGDHPRITLTGIPFEKYALVVYCAADKAGVKFRPVTVNGISYTAEGSNTVVGTANWGTTDEGGPVLGANTLMIEDLTDDTLYIHGTNSQTNVRGTIAAIQLIDRSEEDATRVVKSGTNTASLSLDFDSTVKTIEVLAGAVVLSVNDAMGTILKTGAGDLVLSNYTNTLKIVVAEGRVLLPEGMAEVPSTIIVGENGRVETRLREARTFLHPGLNWTQGDLDRMRYMVAAKREPYYTAFRRFRDSQYCSLSHVFTDRGGQITAGTHINTIASDGKRAMCLGLMYHITGDTRYADKAVEALEANSNYTNISACGTGPLDNGRAYPILEGAELMRDYPGWSKASQDKFKAMTVYPGYSTTVDYGKLYKSENDAKNGVTLYWNCYNFDPPRYGNQGNFAGRLLLALGIYLDNETIYDRAYNEFASLEPRADDLPGPTGPPGVSDNPSKETPYLREWAWYGLSDDVAHYAYDHQLKYYIYSNGQTQETSRDQEHCVCGVSIYAAIAEMAWNQGDDLYGMYDNRILLGSEFNLRYNLSALGEYGEQAVPWSPTDYSETEGDCTFDNGKFYQVRYQNKRNQSLDISPEGRGPTTRNGGGRRSILNHYRHRAGVAEDALKWTQRYCDYMADHYENTAWGDDSTAYWDRFDWGLLTKTREKGMAGDPGSYATGTRVSGIHALPTSLRASDYDTYCGNGEGHTFHRADGKDPGRGESIAAVAVGDWCAYTVGTFTQEVYQVKVSGAGSGTLQFAIGEGESVDCAVSGGTGSCLLTVPAGASVLKWRAMSTDNLALASFAIAPTGEGIVAPEDDDLSTGTRYTGSGELGFTNRVVVANALDNFSDFSGCLTLKDSWLVEAVGMHGEGSQPLYALGSKLTLVLDGAHLDLGKTSNNDYLPAVVVATGSSNEVVNVSARSGGGQNLKFEGGISGGGALRVRQNDRRTSFNADNSGFSGLITLDGSAGSTGNAPGIYFNKVTAGSAAAEWTITRPTTVHLNYSDTASAIKFGALTLDGPTGLVADQANLTVEIGAVEGSFSYLNVPVTGTGLILRKVGETSILALGPNFSLGEGVTLETSATIVTVSTNGAGSTSTLEEARALAGTHLTVTSDTTYSHAQTIADNPYAGKRGSLTVGNGASLSFAAPSWVADNEAKSAAAVSPWGSLELVLTNGTVKGYSNRCNTGFNGTIHVAAGTTNLVQANTSGYGAGCNLYWWNQLSGAGRLNVEQAGRYCELYGDNRAFTGTLAFTGVSSSWQARYIAFKTAESGFPHGTLEVANDRPLEFRHPAGTTLHFGSLVLTNTAMSVNLANSGSLSLGNCAADSRVDVSVTGLPLLLDKVGNTTLTFGTNAALPDGSCVNLKGGTLVFEGDIFTNGFTLVTNRATKIIVKGVTVYPVPEEDEPEEEALVPLDLAALNRGDFARTTEANVISLNFGASYCRLSDCNCTISNTTETGMTLAATCAGNLPGNAWNNLSGAVGTNAPVRVAWNGADKKIEELTSGVKVSWYSGGLYGWGSTRQHFLNSYLNDANGNTNAQVKVENIPYGTYSAIIYLAIDSADAGFTSVLVNGTRYYYDAASGTTKQDTSSLGTERWGQSRYPFAVYGTNVLVVTGLSAPTLEIAGGRYRGQAPKRRCGIAAVQVVEGDDFDAVSDEYTYVPESGKSPVLISMDWIANYFPETAGDPSAIDAMLGVVSPCGERVWSCYMLGIDPTNAVTPFRTLSMVPIAGDAFRIETSTLTPIPGANARIRYILEDSTDQKSWRDADYNADRGVFEWYPPDAPCSFARPKVEVFVK